VSRRARARTPGHGSRAPSHAARASEGRIIAAFGRRYLVEVPGVGPLDCVTRGKRGALACGDRVMVAPVAPGQGVINAVTPRTTLLYRSDRVRQKLIAANVTQIVIVVAPAPAVHEDLVTRCLVAAEHAGIKALVVANKIDLPGSAQALEPVTLYRDLGYRVVALSAKRDPAPLLPFLRGEVSVLVGQSGVGKSTLIGTLVPEAAVRVAELSNALDAGRHTTTHARLYHLDETSSLIDSPGMQEFGLHHVGAQETAHAFVEFRPWLDRCRFRNCLHLSEPGCEITAACERGAISGQRLASYRKLVSARRPKGPS
jgi:ribosome biogenesis GTPase / thiamine phosphate phosphatase